MLPATARLDAPTSISPPAPRPSAELAGWQHMSAIRWAAGLPSTSPLLKPDLVERLVLVSSTAGIDDEATRATRRADDERRAAELERDGVAAFLERWLALPLFADLPADKAQFADRLENTATGLASSLRLAGTGAQQSLWPQLTSLAMPVLLVAGLHDAKFTALADGMAALIPRSTVAIIPEAGHVVHLERPDAFLAALRSWLDATA